MLALSAFRPTKAKGKYKDGDESRRLRAGPGRDVGVLGGSSVAKGLWQDHMRAADYLEEESAHNGTDFLRGSRPVTLGLVGALAFL